MRRYEPLLKIGVGGTATVWVGASAGALGFRQLVAIKRPHEHLSGDPKFVAELMREAKLAARLRHANVVDVRDVEADDRGVDLVMDWVEGASLSDLIRAWSREPPPAPAAVAIRIVLDACAGLRALHELADEHGRPLGCVHRDVSPANVLVGVDGVARITDFGLARPLAVVERTTSEGALRGKLGYMAPEYVLGRPIDARVDVFALGVVLWEALARKRLFRGENDAETLDKVRSASAPPLAIGAASSALDALVARALAKDPDARIATIAELATELERIARAHDLVATHDDVRASFGPTLRGTIEDRRREVEQALARIEGTPFLEAASYSRTGPPPPARSNPPPPIAIAPSGAEGMAARADTARARVAAPTGVLPVASRAPAIGYVALAGASAAIIIAFVLTTMRSRPDVPLETASATPVASISTTRPDITPRTPEPEPGVAVGDLPNAARPARSTTRRPTEPSAPAPRIPSATATATAPDEGKSPRPNPYASGEPR